VSDPFAAPINDAAPKAAAHDGPAKLPGANGKVNGIHLGGVDALHDAAPKAAPQALREAVAEPKPPSPAPDASALSKDQPKSLDDGAKRESPRSSSGADIDPAVEEALIPRRRRGGTHPMAYAFIAAASVFSGVAAYVLFIKAPPQPQIVVVQAAPVLVSATPSATPDDKSQVEVGDLSTAPSGARPLLGKPWPKSSASASAPGPASPLDTSGLMQNGPSGPAAAGPSGPSAAGGQLSQGEMNGVVSSNQPRVRRKCWQPALDGSPPNGPKNARVTVNITIAPSGAVDSASASGAEKDFPGLSSCIASQVKSWKFPASGGSTQVSVPFVFAGQG
jgi:hypothetical protein